MSKQAFLEALEKDRYDITTRLVFADYLDEHDEPEEATEQRRLATPQWCEADRWLREYAARQNCYDDAETAFTDLIKGLRSGDLFFHGSDLHGLYELDDADELKAHSEVWLKKEIDWNEFSFSCSC